MPTFDIVSEVDKTEVKNAIEQTNKEVSTRFDFKGSDARVEQAELKLTVWADNEFQLEPGAGHPECQADQARRGHQVPGDQRQDRKGQRQQGQARLRSQGRRGDRAGEEDRQAHQGQQDSRCRPASRATPCGSPARTATTCRMPSPSSKKPSPTSRCSIRISATEFCGWIDRPADS